MTMLREEIRTDDTGFGGIRVIQRPDFGYGIDSVLLASFAAGETGAKRIRDDAAAAELGSGCGIISFVLAHKMPCVRITGYEKDPDAFARSSKACALNGLEERVSFVNMDILEIDGRSDLDAVLSNPPYFRRTEGRLSSGESPEGYRYAARHETTADIWDFARTASRMLTHGGGLCLVHRPDRLTDILTAMRDALIEPKELQMVVPSYGRPANIVLIRSIKGGNPGLKILPDIAVRKDDGTYTDLILRIYERNQQSGFVV